jgi:hypothetical protein
MPAKVHVVVQFVVSRYIQDGDTNWVDGEHEGIVDIRNLDPPGAPLGAIVTDIANEVESLLRDRHPIALD